MGSCCSRWSRAPRTAADRLGSEEPLRRYTSHTITDPRLLSDELVRIREHGYGLDDGEFVDGWRGVAVPIRSRDGATIAAITCGGPMGRMTTARAEHVRGEMAIIAENLSFQLDLTL